MSRYDCGECQKTPPLSLFWEKGKLWFLTPKIIQIHLGHFWLKTWPKPVGSCRKSSFFMQSIGLSLVWIAIHRVDTSRTKWPSHLSICIHISSCPPISCWSHCETLLFYCPTTIHTSSQLLFQVARAHAATFVSRPHSQDLEAVDLWRFCCSWILTTSN